MVARDRVEIGDGLIPSGILPARMTGVRLSFRRLGRRLFGAFRPLKCEPDWAKTPVLGRFRSGKRMVPLAGLEPAHLSIPHFECGASTSSTTGAREKGP